MKQELVEWAKALIGALLVTMVIIFFIRPTVVYGPSMEPSYYDREYLLISKALVYAKGLEQGDVVVFKTHLKMDSGGEKNLIKRVVGVPGDKVEILDGKVYVNGAELIETYTDGSLTLDNGVTEWVVGEGEYFVLGDNRDNSKDSRFEDVGLIKKTKVMGKVVFRILPFSRAGNIN
jgi:signal peptidase I